MEASARLLHLSCSDLIRLALEQLMQQPELSKSNAPMSTDTEVDSPAGTREVYPDIRSAAESSSAKILAAARNGEIDLHHITRLTYEFQSFMGWRVTIIRMKCKFERYFPERKYGGEASALVAALFIRDYVLKQLELRPADRQKIYAQAMTMESPS